MESIQHDLSSYSIMTETIEKRVELEKETFKIIRESFLFDCVTGSLMV
jgi:hypothetical protein